MSFKRDENMSLRISSVVVTHEGAVRKNNQDNFYLFGHIRENIAENRIFIKKKMTTDCNFVAVFDGMGGETVGEIASLTAAQNISWHPLEALPTEGEEDLSQINEQLCEEARKRKVRCVGTTYVGLFFENGWVRCCNVGDSRCYLLREKKLYILTKDHTVGQQLIDAKKITEREARSSKVWHQLTQNLGLPPEIRVLKPNYSSTVELHKGDRFILCSDGLSDMVCDTEIQKIIGKRKHPSARGKELVEKALSNGGRDNITVILVDIK